MTYMPRNELRDTRRDVLLIRKDYYDHRMRLETVVRKWADVGMSRQEVEDVVFYRSHRSLLPEDRIGAYQSKKVKPKPTVGGRVRKVERAAVVAARDSRAVVLGEMLVARRRKLCVSQDMMAKLSGLPQSHISRLEAGGHIPQGKTIDRLADAYQIPVDWITSALKKETSDELP